MSRPDDKPTNGDEAPGAEAASTPERKKPGETPEQETPEQETAEQRRRRLEAVFGDVLPDTTSDEQDRDDVRRDGGSDAWLRDQVPPHHG